MLALTAQNKPASGIRRADLARDLGPITDLIELAFGPRLDAGGLATVREMRSLSRLGPLLHVLALADTMLKGIGQGFVWEEGGQIIGNVTLFPAPLPVELGRIIVVANVAVDPAYQRRGIARQLMETAVDAIQESGAAAAILQVEGDNDGARRLYEQIGFRSLRVWHTWRRASNAAMPPRVHGGPAIIQRPAGLWKAELALAQRVFPEALGGMGWQRPTHPREFRRSLPGQVLDVLTGTAVERWVVRDGADISAALWAKTHFGGGPVLLTLLIPPEAYDNPAEALMSHALRRLSPVSRPLMCEHPVDDAAGSALLERHQFTVRRTLNHMRLDF